MLYTQMYNETEAEELLLKFGFENLYIFDYFEACAKITWRLGGNYESFLALLERENELLPEDNRVEINRFFKESEDDWAEITKDEYLEREKIAAKLKEKENDR